MIPKQLRKLKFCRIRKGTKKPFEKEWTKKPYHYNEISNFSNENYGVICGYENLAVIDCDKKPLEFAVETLLPKTFTVETGSGGKHFYYFIPELKQKIILETENDEHIGEVQSYGTQVVGAGSIHPNGKPYKVINDDKIVKISLEQLYEVIKPFIKQIKESEEMVELESKMASEIDDLNVAQIWGTTNLKKRGNEYYGKHPIHGSESGMNFWINPSKNMWHCFRCNSGGGVLSAIGVKEGVINCSEAHKGGLRGSKAFHCIKLAKEKYGLKEKVEEKIEPSVKRTDEEIKILWDTDLSEWQLGEQEWIIDKLIPKKSITILTGKRGTLKTFMALIMSYCVASGQKFLDNFEIKKGKVIYLDKENGVYIMNKRTSMIKKGLEIEEKTDVGFICFSTLKIDKLNDIKILEKFLEEHQPKLLVVDTYRRGISFDENDAGEVSKLFVDILRPLVEKFNCSIILIHHNRKGSGEAMDEMDEIRGSSDLANYADIILKMERPRNSGKLILKQLKNRNAPEEKPIQIVTEFSEDSIKLMYDGEYSRKTQTDKCIEVLTLWITANKINQFKTKEAKEIAFKEGIKESSFKNALTTMCDIGEIVNIGFGIYQVK